VGGASRSDVAFSQLTHWGCGLTLEGDLSCFGGQFEEGPFLNVHASFDANGVCLVREDHSAYCIYSFEPYIAKEYAGQYKKVISIDHYGICGITLNDEIRCEPYYIGEENVFYFDVRERSYDILFEYPRDIRVRDIVTEYSGRCACALTLENTIRCWGGLYRDGCRNSLEPLFPGQYLYINTFLALNCGVTLDGRAHCIPEFQQNAERLNPHGPFVKVSHAASCALKTNGEIVCIDQLPPVSETTGRKIVVEEEDYCSLDEQGYATCRDLLTGNVWTSTPNVRFSLIKLDYYGGAYGLDMEGRFYHWAKDSASLNPRLVSLIPDDLRAKNVFPKVNNNICFHKMDDTVQCFLFEGAQPTILNDEMPDPERMFLDVDFQRHFACAVSYTGTLTCWGDIDFPEFQNSDFIDIEYDRNNLCGINTNGSMYCFKRNLDWNMVNVFSGSTMRKLIFISDSVICGLSNGGNVLCEVNSINSFPGDFLLAENIENQFEIYDFMDISSSVLGRQICGIREDVNTLVCRGVTSWGW
jgi:hypothetical protein